MDLGKHNVVPNPSFESGDSWPEGWSRKRREGGERAQFRWDDRVAHSGRRSVMVYSQPMDETCWGAWLCNVPVRGGITWYFSSWMRSDGVTHGALIGWLWNGGIPLRGSFGAASGTHDWRKGEWIVDVPAGRDSLPMGLEFRRANGKAWADDLLAVPYFLKLTGELLAGAGRLSSGEMPPGEADELRQWREELADLGKGVVRWRDEPIERLKGYEATAFELRTRLRRIENRIARARFSEPLVLALCGPLTPVYRQPAEWPSSELEGTVVVEAMRGETESLQLALLSPGQDLGPVRVSFDVLRSAAGQRIAPERMAVYRVEHVQYPTQLGAHGDLWPDVLVPSTEFRLVRGEVQPVWVDIAVPRDQAAGTYEGRLLIAGPDDILLERSVRAVVHAPVLPRPTRMKAVMTVVPSYRLLGAHDTQPRPGEESERIALERISFLARHHVRPFIKFQNTDFMLKAFAMLRRDFGFRWLGAEGLAAEDWRRLYERAVKGGWVDGLFCSVWDEPPGAEAVPKYREFKADYPLAKTLLTLSEHRTAIRDHQDVVDIWCPDSTNWGLDPDFHRSRKYRWHYFCLNGGITDPTVWRQATGTGAWEMGVEGFFYWCAIASSASYHNQEGKWIIVDRFAGDGGIVYPDPRSPIDLYASIRLKLLRDGVEDWELLRCLQESARDCDNRDLRSRADELLLLRRERSEPYPRFIRRVREEAFGLIESIGGITRNG